jgi:AraC-like DNA-binding protein
MVWTMFNNLPNKQMANQISMGLLFTHLMNCTERLNQSAQSFEQNLVFQVLRYIEANYRDGQLGQLCGMLGYDIYWLSRMIKRLTGQNYKDLLQIKRLNQAAYLLSHTRAAVSEISVAVGYDNTSYFHRIFREYYKMSPKEYRRELQASQRGNA